MLTGGLERPWLAKAAAESDPVNERLRVAVEAQVRGAGVLIESSLMEPADRAEVETESLGGISFARIALGVVDQGNRKLHRAGGHLERAECRQRELVVAATKAWYQHGVDFERAQNGGKHWSARVHLPRKAKKDHIGTPGAQRGDCDL